MKHEIKDITEQSLGKQDLFCKKTKQKEKGYIDKVAWVRSQLSKGLRMKILMVTENGKVASRGFIEYMPGEHCWRGIDAPGWFVIHCLWVVGKYKGQGFGAALLDACIDDAKRSGASGVCVMATLKKGWLPGKGLFLKHGFTQVDEYKPVHVLLAKRLSNDTPSPRFIPIPLARLQQFKGKVVVFNSCQCPYIDNIIQEIDESGVPYEIVKFKDAKDARESGVHPYGTYYVAIDGSVVWYSKAGVFKAAALALKRSGA